MIRRKGFTLTELLSLLVAAVMIMAVILFVFVAGHFISKFW